MFDSDLEDLAAPPPRKRGRASGPVTEDDLRETIMATVSELGRGGSVCPTEVSKSLFGLEWRGSMERVRNAATRLAIQGKLVMTQRGKVVDPGEAARGTYRMALPPEGF